MLDPKEEQQFAELKKLAQKLHVPIPEVFIELEVFDKNGKLIQYHKQRSHSWTRNAYNMMFSELASKDADDNTFGAGKLNTKDTVGTLRYGDYPIRISGVITVDAAGTGYRALAGVDTFGILVGSGTNAESLEDFELQTQLTEGTGAGEISHIASEAHAVTYADTTLTNTLIRYFNNNTGGSRDINEVGLVTHSLAGHHASAYVNSLQSRDKLGATVTVPDTGQLKVTYTISLTYAA